MLLALVAAELRFGTLTRDATQPLPDSAAPPPLEELPAPGLPALGSLTHTVERPLFTAQRRPPPPDALDEAAPALGELALPSRAPSGYEVSAIVITEGDEIAYLRGPAGGVLKRLRIGEALDGWVLEEVRADGVVLLNGGRREELALRTFKAAPVPQRRAGELRRLLDPDLDEDEDGFGELADALDDDEADLRRPRRPKRGLRLQARKRAARRAEQVDLE